jgi:hypothetical protein
MWLKLAQELACRQAYARIQDQVILWYHAGASKKTNTDNFLTQSSRVSCGFEGLSLAVNGCFCCTAT